MWNHEPLDLEKFQLRGLHPNVFLGTASDRYAGWLGQVYSKERYAGRITRRTNNVGGKAFAEEVLPIDSVEEYFVHFRTLELDFTFYRLLLDEDGTPTSNYHVLQRYRQHLKKDDQLILKVPQVIFAQKLWRGGKFIENEVYLNTEVFRRRFLEPATELLGPLLQGLIFEQEYQRKKDRIPSTEVAGALDAFFDEVPEYNSYHVELRTKSYLVEPVFEVLEKHGVGQVLSHWTWLPPLSKQFSQAGHRFLNSGGQSIVRLMTPRGVRYEQAYAQAHPFNALVEGMLNRAMVEDTVDLMNFAIDQGVRMNVIVNNRAGGNAPLVARTIAQRFLGRLQQ
ncbi:MAG: DUF72 domain-containing protein [Deltaproteobacteria bacterium]|nr:MAG: DUF72 domain-containing protein [Deltaproteobacteria bacterium]